MTFKMNVVQIYLSVYYKMTRFFILVFFALSPLGQIYASERFIQELNISYKSSVDGILLYTSALKTGNDKKPILVYLPGFDANRYYLYRDLRDKTFILDNFFLVGPEMRGRGAQGHDPFGGTADPDLFKILPEGPRSEGKPDINGWELNDIVDAIEEIKKRYPNDVLDEPIYLMGHSGGAGNILGLLGKYPDYFTAAYAASGISDYEAWAKNPYWKERLQKLLDASVADNPTRYKSRGGRITALNRLTPLYIAHGDKDDAVPFEQAQAYIDESKKFGKEVKFNIIKNGTHDIWGNYPDIVNFLSKYQTPPILPLKGKLIVAGYLFSKQFQITLPSIDSISEYEYDMNKFSFSLKNGFEGKVKIKFFGKNEPAELKCFSGFSPSTLEVLKHENWSEVVFLYNGKAIKCAKKESWPYSVLGKILSFAL